MADAWRCERPPGALFVCQGVCTPNADMILHSVIPPFGAFRSLEHLARATTLQVTAWLSQVPVDGMDGGIVMVDYFEDERCARSLPLPSALVRTVVSRNFLRLAVDPVRLPLLRQRALPPLFGSSHAGAAGRSAGTVSSARTDTSSPSAHTDTSSPNLQATRSSAFVQSGNHCVCCSASALELSRLDFVWQGPVRMCDSGRASPTPSHSWIPGDLVAEVSGGRLYASDAGDEGVVIAASRQTPVVSAGPSSDTGMQSVALDPDVS
jgi:hypothetical protein